MGYYVETSRNHGKAVEIVDRYGATRISQSEAETLVADPATAVICVVDNGAFEAAAFIFSRSEFRDFTGPDDWRKREWLKMNRGLCEKLTGFED